MTAEFKRGTGPIHSNLISDNDQLIRCNCTRTAAEIVDKVFVGSAKWSDLFAPHDFFSKYRYYLQITASSASADTQLKW